MFLTYILALIFLAILGFTAIPVFLFFNMWNTCAAMKSPDSNITSPESICVDVRQYGKRCRLSVGRMFDVPTVKHHRDLTSSTTAL